MKDSKERWKLAAKHELKGQDPIKSLTRFWDNIEVRPYYDSSDINFEITELPDHQSTQSDAPNQWFNLPEVDLANSAQHNQVILDHLQNGADGVFLRVSANTDLPKVLTGVIPEFCFLGFEYDSIDLVLLEKISGLESPEKLNGILFCPAEIKLLSVANLFKGYPRFRCFGVSGIGNTAEEQLSYCLRRAIDVVDTLTDFGFPARSVFNQLGFTLHSGNNFFMDVAKIRSLRFLLERLSMAYGFEQGNAFIRLRVATAVGSAYQPHGDLLGNSFAAIAAVSSRANAITVVSESAQSSTLSRTSRNISLLLKEEAKLDKVVDPFAGSFFIESLTHTLVEKVWNQILIE